MRRFILIVLALALVGYLLTGVTQVQPGERAVVRRFGRVVATPGPGLWLGLPWGFERVNRVPLKEVQDRRVTVGYDTDQESTGQTMPPGQLLTGDLNLVNVQVVVRYGVRERDEDVASYVIHRERVNGLVARTAESALAEWVAGRKVDDVLLTGKAELPPWLVERTQERLQPYGLGIEILETSVPHLFAPTEVQFAFDNVTRSEREIQAQEHKAQQDADDIRRNAEIERVRIEQQTQAYVNERESLARAEADRFTKRLEQYRRLRQENPDILAGIWWDEMGRLFTRLKGNGRIDLLDNHLGADGLDITQFAPSPRK